MKNKHNRSGLIYPPTEQQKDNNIKYQQAIDILTSQGKFHIKLGLERVQQILDILDEQCRRDGNPALLSKLKFIHVAGTNGKGSVCAMLSAILGSSNFKVGLFTSPHVFEYTERIKINDTEIDKGIFALKVIEIVKIADEANIHLTEFEILTAVAFEYFAENNVDIVVLETGLGGRLDSTNIIEQNLCSIITHIDLDHTERLGDTIEKIAFEKAGIIKQNCPVIIGANNAGFEVIKKIAQEKKSDLIFAKELLCHCEELCDEAIQGNKSFGLPRRNCVSPRNDIPLKTLGLKGVYQKENLALVLSAIEVLKENGFTLSQEAINKGLANVKHPCRFELLEKGNILIDGAHNPNGTKALRESLDYYYSGQKFQFVFGCLNNKKYPEMMKNLFKQNDDIYFYHFDNENSCSYEELAKACEFNSKPFSEFKKDENTLTVICGSFYMIKELLTKMGIK